MKWFLLAIVVGPTVAPVQLTVTPQVSVYRYPAFVHAQTRIARHAENRWRTLSWASETGMSGLRLRELAGEHAQVSYDEFIEVTPGAYLIRACIYRTTVVRPDGSPLCAPTVRVRVIGEE